MTLLSPYHSKNTIVVSLSLLGKPLLSGLLIISKDTMTLMSPDHSIDIMNWWSPYRFYGHHHSILYLSC
jgi:hypothetical protein